MRTNKLVWVGVGILAILVVIVAINSVNRPGVKNPQSETVGLNALEPGMKKTSTPPKKVSVKEVTGDTVSESLKNVQIGYETSHKEIKDLKAENKALEERLAKTENRIGVDAKGDDRVNLVAETVDQLKNSLTSLTSQFSTQEKQLKTTTANGYEFSNEDLGIEGTPQKNNKLVAPAMTSILPGYVSVKPLSTRSGSMMNGSSVADSLINKAEQMGLAPQEGLEGAGKHTTVKKGLGEKAIPTPYFTINASATLMDATAMTAMIGRVPVGGRVQDPSPVKIILGDDNLATNGYSIPGLQGIIFEGVATGNWNLSCVTVDLIAATFIFADGRIQHMPNQDKNDYEGKQAGQIDTQPFASDKSRGFNGESIGYISTPQGATCIAGERVTDAPQQLATLGVLGAAKSYFDAKAAAETTTITNSNLDVGSAVTGNKTKFATSATEAGIAQTVIDFYKSHTRDSFDAVVVNPGAEVALHITRDLYGDYNSGSRKLSYSHGGSYDAQTLD